MDQPNVEGAGGADYRAGVPSFGEIVERSLALLERRRRVSHTALRLEFRLDDATFAALRDELVDVLGAADDDGRVFSARASRDADAAQPEHAPPPAPPAAESPAPEPEPEAAPEPAAEAPEPPAAADPEGDPLTVLLCDLVETAELLALDTDRRSAITTRVHAVCEEAARRQRGHVQPWISDGIAIFFGYQQAHDDDALRAVRSGWEILRTLAPTREAIEREFDLRVAVRLGIATGTAPGGDAGGFGETPRLAGRVQAAGTADHVTLDEATRERTSEHFEFEAAADGVFELRGPRQTAAAAPRAPIALVGRTGEHALLRALAERAADGQRAAILVSGEAGVGKTRLLQALSDSARDDLDMAVLHCTSSPYHRGSALHPLLAGLRRHWQLEGAEASARLAERAAGLSGGERTIAMLAALLGVALPDNVAPLRAMSARRRRRESLEVLAEALCVEARRTPLLLVVEDLHWADPTTLELIATLLDGPREIALMLALSARREFLPPPSASLQRVELGRLEADDCARLARLVAGEHALPEDVAAQIASRANGSPLFAEELTRTVVTLQPSEELTAATTLYSCLMARLDRDTTARSVAQLAATIGREFDVSLLQAVGGIEPSALDWGLERLVEEDVLVSSGPGRYAFGHALLQDAARSSLRQETLREYNLQIARALLASFPHVAAAEPERVARHFEYAGELPRSVSYWQQAGMQALAEHALREASGHFERALELTARTPDGDERRAAELALRVLAGLTVALQRGWDAPGAVAHYARAEQLSRTVAGSPTLFRALLGLADNHLISGRIEAAHALSRAQAKVAEAAGDREFVLEAECEAGTALLHLGRFRDALPRLARAIELYDAAGADSHTRRLGRNSAAIALAHRGIALACRDDREGARYAIAQAAALLRANRHPFSQAWVQCAAAAAALICGEREVVRRESAVALKIATEEGFDEWLAAASVLHGWALVQAGEHDEGAEQCRRGVERWAGGGVVIERPFLHGLLADALRRAGDVDFGLISIEEALTACAGGERWCAPELHRIRAELLLTYGDRHGALRSAKTAVGLAQRSAAGAWERRAAATLARVNGTPAVA